MFKKAMKLTLLSVLSLSVLSACGGSGGNVSSGTGDANKGETAEKVSNDPVEIFVYSNFPATANDFDDVFVKPVKAKYPNISLKLVTKKGGHPSITEQVATGEIPDITIGTILNLYEFRDAGLFYDMNPLIKQNKFDLNRIEPAILEEMKSYSDKGELYGLPYTANFTALFYNKDLFDKFGVAYPKDGMMWNEVVDLAKKMTRNADGIQYRGLDPENITRISSPLGVTYVDKQTNKPTIQSWKPGYDLLQSIISIPGNAPTGTIKKFDGDPFFKDKVVAMTATTNAIADFKDNTMNWDLVTYPQYPDHKGTFGVAGARPLMISSASKHKQQAFQVIDTVLSNEVQTKMNRLGTVSPLTDKAVQDAFGADIPYVKGKNLAAIYKLKPGWRKLSDYDDIAADIVFKHSVDMYSGKDINTVIRETEDEITKAIAEEKAKGGK